MTIGEKDEEVKHFLELLTLLSYLDRNGYITIYRHVTEKLYYVQDYFDAPRVVNNTLFLNTKGYYSSSPDTICDGNGNVIYKGVIFRDYRYSLILGAAAGTLLVSESLAGLPDEPDTGEEQTINNKDKEAMNSLKSKKMNLLWIFILPAFWAAAVVVHLLYGRIEGHERQLAYITADYKSLIDTLVEGIAKIKNAETVPPAIAEKMYYGIDISKFNRDIVSEITLHDSITFVICKATEGITYTDPYFYSNFHSISGKYLSDAYHFYRAEDEGKKQADFYREVVSSQGKTDIAPVVDIEQESLPENKKVDMEKLQTEILACLEHLQETSKRIPIIYTNHSFADKYLTDSRFSNYPLWIHDAPTLPKTWKNAGYKIWQKKDNHSIASSLADFDVFFGKLEDLKNNVCLSHLSHYYIFGIRTIGRTILFVPGIDNMQTLHQRFAMLATDRQFFPVRQENTVSVNFLYHFAIDNKRSVYADKVLGM